MAFHTVLAATFLPSQILALHSSQRTYDISRTPLLHHLRVYMVFRPFSVIMFLFCELHCGSGAKLTSLSSVVKEILSSREFQIIEEVDRIIGKKGPIEIAFLLLDGKEDEKRIRKFASDLSGFKGKKVIASLNPISEVTVQAIDPSVIIWDREAIAKEIGRTRIEKLLGEHDHGLIDELIADDYPQIVAPEILEEMHGSELSERIIKPVISIEDVKEISRQTVGGFRYRLELVPYFVYQYSCDLFLDKIKVGAERGCLAVNALTGKVESWNENVDIVLSLDHVFKRLEPTFDADEARNLVKSEVIKIHTHEQEIIRDTGQITIVEKKTVSPSPEDVLIKDMGIFYIPIWCVEGIHGVMILNAGNGKIISEDYYMI